MAELVASLNRALMMAERECVPLFLDDATGRRVRKVVTNGGKDADSSLDGTTDFYYDGWQLIEERDAADTPGAQYAYGNYLDEVWVRDDRAGGSATIASLNDGSGAGRLFHHAGRTFNVVGLTDEAGTLVEAYEYGPYGAHTRISDGPDGDSAVNWSADDTRTASAKSAFGATALYTGQRWDAETGLHYYKRRYYDDGLGRFVSRDPIGTWGDYLAMGNGYGYVGNNSLVGMDPLGLEEAKADNSVAECERLKKTMYQDEFIRKIREGLEKKGCDLPLVWCGECKETWRGYCSEWSEEDGGKFNRRSKIVVCTNNFTDPTEMLEVFRHEFVHASDNCDGKGSIKNKKCNKSICTEIRAYYYSRCQSRGNAAKNCVLEGVKNSSQNSCKGEDIRNKVMALYEHCIDIGVPGPESGPFVLP
ncbi:MAG: RHS repeat-associated core domain-containing protein [Sumerlaeia bacterium]